MLINSNVETMQKLYLECKLQEIMDKRGLTVAQLVDITGLSRNTIQSYLRGSGEVGKGKPAMSRIDITTAGILMQKLGLDFDELFQIQWLDS